MEKISNSVSGDADSDLILEKLRTDEKFFIELCLSVLDRKSGHMIPFKMNSVQEWYETQKTNFDIILKARKLGMSSRIIAGDIWACAFKQNQHAVLLSHDKHDTLVLLEERIKPMIRSSHFDLGATLYKDSIVFPKMNSRYYVGTAGTKRFGRGSDITRFHLSEAAHYESPDVITSVEEGCIEGAVGRLETTAFGNNFFQKIWSRAESKESRYNPVFIGWWRDPDYRILGSKITSYSEDEKKLIEAYQLTDDQLMWRREKLKAMNQPELFDQEYPSSASAAFLSSGRMAFDWVSLAKHLDQAKAPPWIGFIKDNGDSVQFQPQEHGNLHIWKHPQIRRKYVVGADVAEGFKEGCFSVASVIDIGSMEQVAEWHGHLAPDRFADVLMRIGSYYNNAVLAPESWPGVGAVTTARIVENGYRNLWRRPPKGRRTEPSQLYGWETTPKTRPKMIHSLVEATRDYKLIINSKGLVDEMRSMVYDDGGDIYPQTGCFSDRVFATGIAWMIAQELKDGTLGEVLHLRDIERGIENMSNISYPKFYGNRYGRIDQ